MKSSKPTKAKYPKPGHSGKPQVALPREDDRLKSLLALASDWYWEQDQNLRFTRFSSKDAANVDGIDLIGKTLWEAQGLAGDASAQAVVKAKMATREPFHDIEYKHPDAAGGWRYIVLSGAPVFDDSGRFTGYRGIAKDLTTRRREEQLLALEHAVNRCLAEAKSAADGIKTSIRAMCETEGWECGRYFGVDEKAGLLRFADAWGIPDPLIERYIAASQELTYPMGKGITGRVWQTGEPIWVSDRGQHAGLSHKIFGSTRDTFIFPLVADGKTVGVLSFTNREVRPPDERLLQTVRVIGSQLGQFLQRKQAEDVLRESEGRFRSLAALSADVYWEQDAEHRFISFARGSTERLQLRESEFIGKTRWEVGFTNMTEKDWAAHIAVLDARQPFHDMELCRVDRSNNIWLSISGHPVFDNAGVFKGYRGVGKDITARKRDEHLLALEHTVNRGLAVAENLSTGLQGVLRAVCESEGWECGRYFGIDETAGVMLVIEDWGIPDPAVASYLAASRTRTPALHRGVKGRAWSTGEPQWGSEANRKERLAEKHLGSARAAFAFPAIAEGKAIGIVSFTSRDLREADLRLLQAVRIIGSQVGQFVQRKHAEQATMRLGRMFAALSATNDAILHAKSPEELYQQVCDAAVHGGNFSNTSILVAQQNDNRIKTVAGAGRILQEVKEAVVSIDETIPEGRGLVGIAFRTQKLAISNDFLNDERTQPWHEVGRKVGCRSAAALPLIQGGRSVGVVLIHYDELNAFDDETVKLLERMAENVSFALGNFEREVERQRAQERIQYLATHDGLTALPNRVMFSQVLNLAIESARRYNRNFAVLFLDLDRFKVINDTLGHEAGDTLLQEMSGRIKENLRASDVVARLGGDEFVVLVQEVTEPAQVTTVARKLLSAIIRPVMVLGQECRVTASIGISMYPTDAEDEQSLMKNADMAMYLAKEEGKNNFRFYSKDIKTQSLERLTLETSLRRALEREEFLLHYQAKLDLKTSKVTGVEALVRWQHPDLGMVSPLQFIPLAEETGLIVPIGRWVLNTACAQNVAWQRAGLPPVCIAVNLSPRQFADENLLQDLATILQKTGMDPKLLELEITESMVMSNIERAAKQLNAIKQMGVRLAIDDFGTGYSSLAQIKRFPIDTIKVDRSFIRDIPQDAEDKAITEAIIAMGKTLSLTVVAEGVETQAQKTFLSEHACDEMQGYHFSKPGTAEQFAELLKVHG